MSCVVEEQDSATLTGDNDTAHCLPHRSLLPLGPRALAHGSNLSFLVVLLLTLVPSSIAEGERAQGGVTSCLDPPRSVEGFLTAPPSGEATPTAPHEQALVSLETAIGQQVHQPIAELLLTDPQGDSLGALAAAVPQLSAPDRPNCESEASQMELSPAPAGVDRGAGGGGTSLDTSGEGEATDISSYLPRNVF